MFKKIKFYLRDYFAFNQTEIKGFMFMIFLIIVLIISVFIFDFLPDNPQTTKTIDPKRVEELMAKIEVKESDKKEAFKDRYANKYEKYDSDNSPSKPIRLAPFDPNQASEAQLEELGIAKWMAKRIINYLKVGDTVKQGEDMGFIRFGSRVDMFFPLGTKIDVNINEHVKGNKTVIAKIADQGFEIAFALCGKVSLSRRRLVRQEDGADLNEAGWRILHVLK